MKADNYNLACQHRAALQRLEAVLASEAALTVQLTDQTSMLRRLERICLELEAHPIQLLPAVRAPPSPSMPALVELCASLDPYPYPHLHRSRSSPRGTCPLLRRRRCWLPTPDRRRSPWRSRRVSARPLPTAVGTLYSIRNGKCELGDGARAGQAKPPVRVLSAVSHS